MIKAIWNLWVDKLPPVCKDEQRRPKATILARGKYKSAGAKTSHGLVLHSRRYKICEIIDESLVGKDAGEVLGVGTYGIPIVERVNPELDALIIGVAPVGGRLPKTWRSDIIFALEHGMDVISGLHDFIADDAEFRAVAERSGAKIIDVRRPPPISSLKIAKGKRTSVPVVLVCGTDSAVGKRTVTLELVYEAERRGINVGYVATGQTGIMIGCDAGVVVDRVPADFVSGIVEAMVNYVGDELKKNLIIVEGQGALSHVAYGSVALGILQGSKPDYVVMVHDPALKTRGSFPTEPMPSVESEIELISRHSERTKIVAIALNTRHFKGDINRLIDDYEQRTGLPVTDVLKMDAGSSKILDVILQKLPAPITTTVGSRGKLIVIEGIDGAGKKTQAELLKKALEERGIKVDILNFPLYETPLGNLVRKYLRGEFGPKDKLPVEVPTLLYALDRYQYRADIEAGLNKGLWYIADRYTTSNFAYQSTKYPPNERMRFIKWIAEVESRLPQPDLIIYLHISPEYADELIKLRAQAVDIHESDRDYQREVMLTYTQLASMLQNWIKIDCIVDNKLLDKFTIHKRIIQEVERRLLI